MYRSLKQKTSFVLPYQTTYLMRYLPVYVLLFISMVTGCSQPEQQSLSRLRSKIDSMFQATPGDFAIAFKNLENPEEVILIHEKEDFHAASTMKTPVMIEVYKQVAAGKFSLGDSLPVENEFKSIVDSSSFSLDINDDSGEQLYSQIGKKRTIRDLVVDMIIYSSNLATNIVIELVDAGKVNETMRMLGAMDINVLRGVEDIKAYNLGLSNTTTAYDLMLIYEKLASGEVVSREASEEMIDILFRQTHNDIIPAKLPETVKVAHKTGSITGVHHDSGIVYLPDGRKYVLVLLSKNMEDFDEGTEMLATVSKKIYEYVSAQKGE